MNTTLRKRLLCICETAIFIALAFVLNFAKLELLGFRAVRFRSR
ncbi:MAG: hypothetical protein ACLUFV_11375 [Acutalibacteraceae bacterium]